MIKDVFVWWLTAQAFGLAGLPLTRFVFRALPDRGYAFGKTLGLLLTGYLAWLIAMLGLAPFGRALLIVCALIVGGIGLFFIRDQRPKTKDQRGDRASEASSPRSQVPSPKSQTSSLDGLKLVLGYELIFALALIFLVLLRIRDYQVIINPNPWGTERPMDYALFNAIRRSASFPPHDPWLSGYSINYYYFGYLLMAAVSLVSGIGWGAAYNLSLALTFALTALGVAGIVANLIALTTNHQRSNVQTFERSNVQGLVIGRWSLVVGRMVAVLLAVVLVLFAANQSGALQVLVGDQRVVALDGRQLGSALVQAAQGRPQIELPYPANTSQDGFGLFSTLDRTDRVKDFDWWWPSRSVWDSYPVADDLASPRERRYTITEFPFFSFWLGDMHPHVMALPFGLLALALALQTIARPAAPTFGMGRRGWVELAVTGIILGSLYFINSWDLPTYVLLFLGALLLLYIRLGTRREARGERGELPLASRLSPLAGVWWRHYAGQAVAALLAAGLLIAPFLLTFRSLVGGKDPLISLPILSTITRTLGFVTWSKTWLHSFLIIFGLFLLPLVVYVFVVGREQCDYAIEQQEPALSLPKDDTLADEAGSVTRSPAHPLTRSLAHSLTPPLWRYFPYIILAALLLGLLIGFPLLALLPLAIYAAKLAVDRADRPATAFALWGFALVCLICFGTEIVYIRDVFESRMNTIFKFYYQAWLIWGVLAGYALWWLFARPAFECSNVQTLKRSNVRRWSLAIFAAVFAALLAGALVYPLLTAGKAFHEGQRAGLDGKTPREKTPEGAAAIEWLRANAPAGAVVLEAAGGDYDTQALGFGQVSGSTGLATVLGWRGHEEQWRGGDPAVLALLGPREADVAAIYSTPDVSQAAALLKKYDVAYIYVGAADRATYPPEGLAKLDQLGDPVFQQG
ncbi:MAG TPA: DUF2298 domain-containing protein, partial [Roseiflexaceae bacterium]